MKVKKEVLFKLLCTQLMVTMVACREQTTLNTVEDFNSALKQCIASAEDAKTITAQNSTTVLHLANADIGIKDFYDLHAKLSGKESKKGVVSMINIRKCYNNGTKNTLTDIITALQRYFENREKGVVYYKNLELMILMMKEDDIAEFDTLNKNLGTLESFYNDMNSITNRVAIENTFDMLKQVLVSKLYETANLLIYGDSVTLPLDQNSIIGGLISEYKGFFDSVKLTDIPWELLDEADSKSNTSKRISDYCNEYYGTRNLQPHDQYEQLIDDLESKCGQKRTTFFDLCIKHLRTKYEILFSNESIALYRDVCNNFCKKLIDDVNGGASTVCEMETDDVDSTYHLMAIFDEYFGNATYKDLIESIISDLIKETDNDINRKYHCDDSIKIFCNSELKHSDFDSICHILVQTNILDNPNICHSIYIEQGVKTTKSDIETFEWHLRNRQPAQSGKFIYNPRDDVTLDIFYHDESNASSLFAKHTIGGNNEVNFDEYDIIPETSETMEDLHKKGIVEILKYNCSVVVSELRENVKESWTNLTSLGYNDVVDFCTISIADKEITIFSKFKDGNKKSKISVINRIKDLHLISQNNQLFKPTQKQEGIELIENAPDTFLADLISFLHLAISINKLPEINDVYPTPDVGFYFKEDFINYVAIKKFDRVEMRDKMHEITKKSFLSLTKFYNFELVTINCALYSFTEGDYDYDIKNHIKNEFADYDTLKNSFDQISDSFITNKRYREALLHHYAVDGNFTDTEPVAIYSFKTNDSVIALFIVMNDYKNDIDSSIATLPLVTLFKTLKKIDNPNDRARSATNGSISETNIISEVLKYIKLHRCSSTRANIIHTEQELKEYYDQFVSNVSNDSEGSDIEDWEFINDGRTMDVLAANANNERDSGLKFIFKSIKNDVMVKRMKITTILFDKPDEQKVAMIKQFKRALEENLQKRMPKNWDEFKKPVKGVKKTQETIILDEEKEVKESQEIIILDEEKEDEESEEIIILDEEKEDEESQEIKILDEKKETKESQEVSILDKEKEVEESENISMGEAVMKDLTSALSDAIQARDMEALTKALTEAMEDEDFEIDDYESKF